MTAQMKTNNSTMSKPASPNPTSIEESIDEDGGIDEILLSELRAEFNEKISKVKVHTEQTKPGESVTCSTELLVNCIARILCREGVLGKDDWGSLEPDFQMMLLGVLREEGKLSITDLQRVSRILGNQIKAQSVPTESMGSNFDNYDTPKRRTRKFDFFFEFCVKRNPVDSFIPPHHRSEWYEATARGLGADPERLRNALLDKCEMYVLFSALILSGMIGFFASDLVIDTNLDAIIWLLVEVNIFSSLVVLGMYMIAFIQISAIPDSNLVLWLKANLTMFSFAGKSVTSTLVSLFGLVGCLIWRLVIQASEEVPTAMQYLPGAAFILLFIVTIDIQLYHVNVGTRSLIETGCLRNSPIVSEDEARNMTQEEAQDVLFSRGFNKRWMTEPTSSIIPRHQSRRNQHRRSLGPRVEAGAIF